MKIVIGINGLGKKFDGSNREQRFPDTRINLFSVKSRDGLKILHLNYDINVRILGKERTIMVELG